MYTLYCTLIQDQSCDLSFLFLIPLRKSMSRLGYNRKEKNIKKKSRIRETLNLSTIADSSTDATVGCTKNTQKPKKI